MTRVTNGAARSARGLELLGVRRVGKRLRRGRMTLAAGLGNPLGTGRGQRIADGAGVVNAVAIHTLSGPLARRREPLAVNAVRVLGQRIHARGRLVFAREIGVAVTVSAKFGDALALDPELEAATRAHRDVLIAFAGIATVATGATDRVGEMDVIGELQAHSFHDTVTIEAGILAGPGSAAQQQEQPDQNRSAPACFKFYSASSHLASAIL